MATSWRYVRRSSLTATKGFVYGSSMKMRQSNLPKPTEGELELLRVLWIKGSATVRELHEAVSLDRALGYTTVLKLMQIMAEKGLVERDETERAQHGCQRGRVNGTNGANRDRRFCQTAGGGGGIDLLLVPQGRLRDGAGVVCLGQVAAFLQLG